MGPVANIITIAVIWLLSVGLGTWVTYFEQPEEIEELRKTEKLARIRQSEVASLLSQETDVRGRASEIQTRWDSRYKTIPTELKSHEVVAYLNSLSENGFESFNMAYAENRMGGAFRTHIFRVEGRGDYSALYDFVWAIENYRSFYRITDFELSHIDLPSVDRKTGAERLRVAVSFNFKVEAYYGGKAGLSADDQLPGVATASITPRTELPPVPASVLPSRRPAKNPFYPIIMSNIPPNSDGLLDLDISDLLSIVDGKAVFSTAVKSAASGKSVDALTTVGVGDDVYLGRIIMIDPVNRRVVARLNIGGIMDERIFELEAPDAFRQAIGPTQLAPSN